MFNMNSGYSGYSMSNRAVEAYDNGEMPMSKWTKEAIMRQIKDYLNSDDLKCTPSLLKKAPVKVLRELLLCYSSWHHTSKMCNHTDFYSIDYDKLENLTDEEILDAIEEEKIRKSYKPEKVEYRGDIYYLEWEGSRRHPKPIEQCLENVNIEERGCFYIVTNDKGVELLRKKMFSNGTYVVNYKEVEERKRQEEEKAAFVRANSSKEAMEFWDEIADDYEKSFSSHIYKRDRKPRPGDYESGLDNFLKVGEHRLYEEHDSGILHLETWNGTEWVKEEL